MPSDVKTLASPLAGLIVLVLPIAGVLAAGALFDWGRWVVRTAGLAGVAGLVVTAAFVVNLGIARRCDHQTNRPVISLVLSRGDCERTAKAWTGAAAIAGVATSVGAEALRRRRPAPAGAGGGPCVQPR